MTRPRVVVVDDNTDILKVAAETLATACVIVGTATCGCDALVMVRSLTPDVLVLDVSMPGMNGLAVAQLLRADRASPAIVFMSIHEDEALVQAAYDAGGAGYVVKSRMGSALLPAVLAAYAKRIRANAS